MSPAAGRIVEAARTIAAARGLDALSVQAVATAAGVHKSAIGYHFGNKQGLVLALIESLGHEESNKARRAVGRVADPSERFHAYLSLYRELVMTSDHWRLAIALGPAPHYDEKTKVLGRSVALDLGALHLRPEDAKARVLMSVLQAAITGLALQYEARGSEMDLEACFARLEEALAPAFLRAMKDAG